MTFSLKNDMRNLVNFNARSVKSENVKFDVLLWCATRKLVNFHTISWKLCYVNMTYIMFAGMYVLDKSSPSNLNFLNSPLLVLSCPNYYWNPNRKCPEVPQSSISAHHFPNNPSFSKVSEPPGWNQQNGKQCCLPPLPLKISLMIDLFILLSTFIYLSRILKFMMLKFLENGLNLWIIIHVPIPHIKP